MEGTLKAVRAEFACESPRGIRRHILYRKCKLSNHERPSRQRTVVKVQINGQPGSTAIDRFIVPFIVGVSSGWGSVQKYISNNSCVAWSPPTSCIDRSVCQIIALTGGATGVISGMDQIMSLTVAAAISIGNGVAIHQGRLLFIKDHQQIWQDMGK